MMHKATIARLREDIEALKRHTPSAMLFIYNVLDDDCHRDSYVSGEGAGPITAIRVPCEVESVREWLTYVNSGEV
jgi:hypothetical protein